MPRKSLPAPDPESGVDLAELNRLKSGPDIPSEDAIAERMPSCVVGHSGRLYPSVDTPLSRCPTNLPLDTREGKSLLLAAGNPGDIDFNDSIRDEQGRRFLIVRARYFVVFPDSSIDPETGEVGTFARTVLITADGRTFRTSSAHAPHRIQAALDLFGPDEWVDTLPFRITERPSKNTKRGNYHDIRLDR